MFDSNNRKFVKTQMTVEAPYGHGNVTGKFKAEKFDGHPMMDTHVEISITPFSVTWEQKEQMLREIAAVIAKYQI
jgi:hypothetical protein